MKKQPNIAMVTYLFPPTFAGGARHALELAKGLERQGVHSFFIGANMENAPAFEIFEGFPVHRIRTMDKGRMNYLAYAMNVCRILFSERKSFDIIHLHSIRPFYFLISVMAKLLGKPVVLCPTLIGHDDPMSLKGKSFLWALEGKIYGRYDMIICKSSAVRISCLEAKIPERRVCTIPGAIPCSGPGSLFRPADGPEEVRRTRAALGLPAGGFIVAFTGHIQTRKGCDLLLDAWDELLKRPGFDGYLLLIGPYEKALKGEGSEADFSLRLREYISKSAEKRAIFTGNRSHGEVAEYLRASDCMVFPSRRESFGKVVIEAMASGVPVISTLIPDITTDMIEDGKDGIILESREPEALAKAILRIKEDEGLRRSISVNAVEKVKERFSIEKVVALHMEVYNSLYRAPIVRVAEGKGIL